MLGTSVDLSQTAGHHSRCIPSPEQELRRFRGQPGMTTNILGGGWRGMQLSQERIVFAIAAILSVAFSIFLNNFLNTDNILSLIQNVSILGILGIGMALTIIGRGIDLSMVATMAMSVAWSLDLIGQGVGVPLALLIGLALVVLIGVLNGVLIAYVEIPAIFATLAMGTLVYGFGRYFLMRPTSSISPQSAGWLWQSAAATPSACRARSSSSRSLCLLAYLFLRYTKPGRYLCAVGDNPMAARASPAFRPAR